MKRPISTILFVDDAPTAHTAYRRMIPAPRRVEKAMSAAEAIEILEREPIDFVVVDVLMPERNGIELLLDIRERWPDMGVAMISGGWTLRMIRAAMQAGAYDCLEKQPNGLRALLERYERGLPPEADHGPFEARTLEQLRDDFYLGVCEMYGGNVTRAAAHIGIRRSSFQRIVKGIRERRARESDGLIDLGWSST